MAMLTIALLFSVIIIFCTQDLVLVNGCVAGVVRLSGGTYSFEGRVEICVNNTWGTVCDDSFDFNDATVVCHQLGYTSAYTYHSSAYYGQGSGPIWLDEVSCTGIEFGLLQCTNYGIGRHDCSHSEDVSVRCSGSSSASCVNGDVRLVGSSNSSSGRVEVCANNVWGTVCDDYWNDVDASVVCRMLNFTGNAYGYQSAHFGEGTGSILLDNVQCIGTEYSVFSCAHNTIGTNDCSHYEDASVVCLSSSYSDCVYGQLRLVNGANQYEGRVEICINNVWGTVCDDYWDTYDARVACRQLGYPTTNVTAYSNAHFGAGTGSILLDDVDCYGYESSLLSCSHNTIGSNDCSHYEDAGVSCYSYVSTTCTYGQLRLVNGLTSHEGRVEICINNVWGTVCDDGWDRYNARVVCRQLGYSGSNVIAYSNAYFGSGTGPIQLDDVNCNGYESSLLSCSHNTIGSNDCSHSEDAGVSCYGQGGYISIGGVVGISIAAMFSLLGCIFCLIVIPIVIVLLYKNSRRNMYSSRRQQNTSQSTPASTAINVSEPDDVNIRFPPTGSQGIAGSGYPVTQVANTEYMVAMETLPRYDEIDDNETCILLNQTDS